MKRINCQQVDFAGRFSIKLELMPIEVKSRTIPFYYYFIVAGFLLLAICFIAAAFWIYWKDAVIVWASILTLAFLLENLIWPRRKITFTRESIQTRINPWFIIGRVSRTESLRDFTHVVGRRFYSFVLPGDQPSLVREVILQHENKPENNVILARFIEEKYVDIEKEWKDYWNKASMLLDKAVINQIDDKSEVIDPAMIIIQDGDGGAFKPNKTKK